MQRHTLGAIHSVHFITEKYFISNTKLIIIILFILLLELEYGCKVGRLLMLLGNFMKINATNRSEQLQMQLENVTIKMAGY